MSDLQDHATADDNMDHLASEQQQPMNEQIARWSRRLSMMSAADLESMEQHFSQIETTRNQTERTQVSSISNLSMKARLPKPLKSRAEYPAWMKQMKICLKTLDLEAAIENEQISMNPALNKAALNILNTSVSFRMVDQLDEESAYASWENLRKYCMRDSMNALATERTKLNRLSYRGGSVRQHVDQFEEIVRNIRLRGKVLDNYEQVHALLSSIQHSPQLSIFRTTHLSRYPNESCDIYQLKGALEDYASDIGIWDQTKQKPQKANFAKGKRNGKSQGSKRKFFKCHACGKPGHYARDCKERIESSKGKPDESSKSEGCNMVVTETEYCNHTVSSDSDTDTEHGWILDSGCTIHITNNRKVLFDVENLEDKITVCGPDGKTIGHANIKGKVMFDGGFTATDVIYIPTIKQNLLSLGKLMGKPGLGISSQGKSFILTKDGCTLTCSTNGSTLLRVNEQPCIFYPEVLNNLSHESLAGLDLWHHRLGHASRDVLLRMHKEALVDGLNLKLVCKSHCKGCILGKQVKRPLRKKAIKRSATPGERIHVDLIGPMRNPSIRGYRYLITIVDDATRIFTCLPLATKHHATEVLEQYMAWSDRQTGNSMKFLRADRAKELNLVDFCRSKGIERERTIRGTSLMNGVAERANRTIMDMARSCLHSSSLKSNSWCFAAEFAAYTHNYISTTANLDDKTPYELWTSRKPDVSHLRIFGVPCYSLVSNQGKENERGQKCLMVGYAKDLFSVDSKGYKLLDRINGNDAHTIDRYDVEFLEEEILKLSDDKASPKDSVFELAEEHIRPHTPTEKSWVLSKAQILNSENNIVNDDVGSISSVSQAEDVLTTLIREARIKAFEEDGSPSGLSVASKDSQLTIAGDLPPPARQYSDMAKGDNNIEYTNVTDPHLDGDKTAVLVSEHTGMKSDQLLSSIDQGSLKDANDEEHKEDSKPESPHQSKIQSSSKNNNDRSPDEIQDNRSGGRDELLSEQKPAKVKEGRYPTRLRKPSKRYGINLVLDRLKSEIAFQVFQKVPKNFNEAMMRKDKEKWKEAINKEMNSLVKNKTWEVVDRPTGRKVIKCTWVFKVKQDAQGHLERYKARLCACGYSQREGEDFIEIFAPVVKFPTIRLLLSILVTMGWKSVHLDVDTAFLYGTIDYEIYMELPAGFYHKERKHGKVVRLLKSLYGLKQAARIWNQVLHGVLIQFGFKQTQMDNCCYIWTRNQETIILSVYVDDMFAIYNTEAGIKELEKFLQKHFSMKFLGQVNFLLGMQIDRTKDALVLHQNLYVSDSLIKYQLDQVKERDTPMEANLRLHSILETETKVSDHNRYRSMVGTGMYAMVGTRPDIAFAIGRISKFLENPSTIHEAALKRIFQYLKKTQGFGLHYPKPPAKTTNSARKALIKLEAHVDASYGTSEDYKSISGYVITLNGTPISWASKTQSVTALSSTEAEYIAMCKVTQEVIWYRQLLDELGFAQDGPTVIHEDNQAAIHLSKNPIGHQRAKHIHIRYHFLKEQVKLGVVTFQYCPTNNMLGDCLTKALAKAKFDSFRNEMNLFNGLKDKG